MVLFLDVIQRAMIFFVAGILLLIPQCNCQRIEYYSKENTTYDRVLNDLDSWRFCGYALAQRFTSTGFKISSLPIDLKQRLLSFYERWQSMKQREAPIDFIWRNDREIYNGSESLVNFVDLRRELPLKIALVNAMRLELEEWAEGSLLQFTSAYGIREYTRGSVLKPHVDRPNTHVLSAIINVHQDVDEPWPLVLFDHNNERHEIFLNDSMDVILYESATVIHGRPYPLKGASYANIFVHFAPIGWYQAVGESIQTCINQTELLCPEDGDVCKKANLSHYVTDNSLIIDACDHNYQRATDLSRTFNRYLYI